MNRYSFANKMPADSLVIDAPDYVVFKILETKEFVSEYWNGKSWKWHHPKDTTKTIEKHRIIILSGSMMYANREEPLTFRSGEVWVGKKWIERRLREREIRQRKKILGKRTYYGK